MSTIKIQVDPHIMKTASGHEIILRACDELTKQGKENFFRDDPNKDPMVFVNGVGYEINLDFCDSSVTFVPTSELIDPNEKAKL